MSALCLNWLGQKRGEDEPPEVPNALEIYEHLVIGGGEMQLLSARSHQAVHMKNGNLWQLLATEISELAEPELSDEVGVPEDKFLWLEDRGDGAAA